MTSAGIGIPCLTIPEKRKIDIKSPDIKLTGILNRKYPNTKYRIVDMKFPIKIVINTLK
ncbi:MAG: hypothetical protein V3R31_02180 [Candidatus Humimicrobiaceae bacterium]